MIMDTATVRNLYETVATSMSAQGLVAWLAAGHVDPAAYSGYRPLTTSDLDVCQLTFDALDEPNQAVAAPLMAQFTAEVQARNARRRRFTPGDAANAAADRRQGWDG
jgi:hypothetical protein